MMKFFEKTKGAVSIFLVLVLVPMMTVASIFVDASKVKLSRGVAESAANLTLNTALTEYDTKLKELYGLFATAQDTDELYEKLEDYYRSCITSSGVGEDEADDFVAMIMTQLGLIGSDNDTADLLNMQLVDFEVSKVPDATLANPSILEKEIVDFMKYRGPINTGLSFLSSLKSFSTLSKQTDLVDKRQEYYEEEQSVMEKLKEAWGHINEYNKLELITDENYFDDLATYFGNAEALKDDYKIFVNRKTIMDLYDTQNYVDFQYSANKITNQSVKDASGNTHYEDIWRFNVPTKNSVVPLDDFRKLYDRGTYSKDNKPSVSTIKSYMSWFYSATRSMRANKADFWKTKPANAYELQGLVQDMRKGLSRYAGSMATVYDYYQKVRNAMIWFEAYDADAEERKDAESIELKNANNNTVTKSLYGHFQSIQTIFEQEMKSFSEIAQVYYNISYDVRSRGLTKSDDVNLIVNDRGTKISKYAEVLEAGAKELKEASDILKDVKGDISAGGSLDSAKQDWKSAASDNDLKDSSLAKQDLAEINELGTYLNSDDLQKFIDRLDNVSDKLTTTVTEIKKFKYYGKFLGDILSYEDVHSLLYNKIGDGQLHWVPIDESELIKQADDWFQWESGNVDGNWVNRSESNPKLHGSGTDKLNFYSYLYTHFNTGEVSASTEEKEENADLGKNLYDNLKDDAGDQSGDDLNSAKEGNEASDNEISSFGDALPSNGFSESAAAIDNPSTDSNDAVKNTSSGLGSMFSSLGRALVDFGADLRDKLFISDYIISMFSYDTIEKEYEHDSSKLTETPQTLTLIPIDAEHNYAYGREIEYILYGGNNTGNVVKAYGSIFGIRLGFNLIYAFMDSGIRDTALAIATPISAATLGIVPVPLIQAGIIVGIACLESAYDLIELREGKAVPLYKNEKTWHFSPAGLVRAVKDAAVEIAKDVVGNGIDYAAGKLSEMLDMTNEELSNFINDKANDLETNVNAAFDTMVMQHANTAIQKMTTLVNTAFEKAASDVTFTRERMIEYVQTQLNSWANSQPDSDSIASLVINKAVEVINREYVGKVIDAMQSMRDNVEEAVNNCGEALTDILEGLRSRLSSAILDGSAKLLEYKNNMFNKMKESMAEGADKLKETLNEQLDGIFGSGSGFGGEASGNATGISSLLSFTYSDYLRLFLMIGLYTNEQNIVLRTADAIQANMTLAADNTGYRLNQSAVYISFHANVLVKPTFLAMPLFADIQNNPVSDTSWYTIDYSTLKGY